VSDRASNINGKQRFLIPVFSDLVAVSLTQPRAFITWCEPYDVWLGITPDSTLPLNG